MGRGAHYRLIWSAGETESGNGAGTERMPIMFGLLPLFLFPPSALSFPLSELFLHLVAVLALSSPKQKFLSFVPAAAAAACSARSLNISNCNQLAGDLRSPAHIHLATVVAGASPSPTPAGVSCFSFICL